MPLTSGHGWLARTTSLWPGYRQSQTGAGASRPACFSLRGAAEGCTPICLQAEACTPLCSRVRGASRSGAGNPSPVRPRAGWTRLPSSLGSNARALAGTRRSRASANTRRGARSSTDIAAGAANRAKDGKKWLGDPAPHPAHGRADAVGHGGHVAVHEVHLRGHGGHRG